MSCSAGRSQIPTVSGTLPSVTLQEPLPAHVSPYHPADGGSSEVLTLQPVGASSSDSCQNRFLFQPAEPLTVAGSYTVTAEYTEARHDLARALSKQAARIRSRAGGPSRCCNSPNCFGQAPEKVAWLLPSRAASCKSLGPAPSAQLPPSEQASPMNKTPLELCRWAAGVAWRPPAQSGLVVWVQPCHAACTPLSR